MIRGGNDQFSHAQCVAKHIPLRLRALRHPRMHGAAWSGTCQREACVARWQARRMLRRKSQSMRRIGNESCVPTPFGTLPSGHVGRVPMLADYPLTVSQRGCVCVCVKLASAMQSIPVRCLLTPMGVERMGVSDLHSNLRSAGCARNPRNRLKGGVPSAEIVLPRISSSEGHHHECLFTRFCRTCLGRFARL